MRGQTTAPVTTPLPASVEQWEQGRAALRAKLWSLLGDMPPAFTPTATPAGSEKRNGYTLEKFTFDNRAGATVYGYALVPDASPNAPAKRPAILYNHFHGGQYKLGKDEMITPAFKQTLGDLIPAEELRGPALSSWESTATRSARATLKARVERASRDNRSNGRRRSCFSGKAARCGE